MSNTFGIHLKGNVEYAYTFKHTILLKFAMNYAKTWFRMNDHRNSMMFFISLLIKSKIILNCFCIHSSTSFKSWGSVQLLILMLVVVLNYFYLIKEIYVSSWSFPFPPLAHDRRLLVALLPPADRSAFLALFNLRSSSSFLALSLSSLRFWAFSRLIVSL